MDCSRIFYADNNTYTAITNALHKQLSVEKDNIYKIVHEGGMVGDRDSTKQAINDYQLLNNLWS